MRNVYGNQANFDVVEQNDRKGYVVIKDLGPWDQFMTVTNAAEWVVEKLFVDGILKQGERLFYWDSEGTLDEIIIVDNQFAGFRPGRLP